MKVELTDILEAMQAALAQERQATDARIAEAVAEATAQVRAECADQMQALQKTRSDDIEAALTLITELQGEVAAARMVGADLLQIENRITEALDGVSRSVSTFADNLDLLEESTAETVSGLEARLDALADAKADRTGLNEIDARVTNLDRALCEHQEATDEVLGSVKERITLDRNEVTKMVTDVTDVVLAQIEEQNARLNSQSELATDRMETLDRTLNEHMEWVGGALEDVTKQIDQQSELHAALRQEVATTTGTVVGLNANFADQRKDLEYMTGRMDSFLAVVQDVEAKIPDQTPLWDALRAMQARTEDALSGQDDALLAQVDALEQAIEAGLDAVRGDIMPLVERVGLLGSYVDQVVDKTRETVTVELLKETAQYRLTMEEMLDDVRRTIALQLTGAEPWARGGAQYKAHAVVTHRGGVWMATERTGDEPAVAPENPWMLLADGLTEVSSQVNDDGQAAVRLQTASGRVSDIVFDLPVPKVRGVYSGTPSDYQRYDAVVKDSHTFMAVQTPTGAPGEVMGEWLQIGHRGKPGRNGKSVALKDVAEATVELLTAQEGPPPPVDVEPTEYGPKVLQL